VTQPVVDAVAAGVAGVPRATVVLNHVIVHGADLRWRVAVALPLLALLLLVRLLAFAYGDRIAWVI